MSEYIFRYATKHDENAIRRLLLQCFGEFAIMRGALSYVEGRYIVAEYHHNNISEIVAMTGIIMSNRYDGYEITWTCTAKEHRQKGLIVKMLEEFEKLLPDDKLPIYCECWRMDGNDKPNLSSVMKHMGMHEIINGIYIFSSCYFIECKDCIHYKESCQCYNDLYRKNRNI